MTRPNPAPHATSPEQRTAHALQRIEASRTLLILTLAPQSPRPSKRKTPPSPGGSATNNTAKEAPFSATLAAHLTQDGFGTGTWQALTDAATEWLDKQPWYASAELVGSTVVHQVKPIVRRHPWLSLGAAAAVGAALVALRPWGWKPVQNRVTPWRGQVGSVVWGQLTQAPVQMALAGALAAWLSRAGASAPPNPPPPETDTTASKKTDVSPQADTRSVSSPGVMPAPPPGAP